MKVIFKDRKRKIIIIITSVALIIALIIGGSAVYLSDFYRSDENAISAFAPMNKVDFRTLENGNIIFEAENANAGFIFYPGGKVDINAYKPLMAVLAEKGVTCVLVEMPFNLAVLDINAADGIIEQYPDIEKWYIGGHSLGGSMAATYLSDNADSFEGLVLLGSYSTENLSNTDLDVLSIYGSEDGVMNRKKYDANKGNLPNGFTEIVIEGGNHAGFGMYGTQDGDGESKIPTEEQIKITADAVLELINKE